MSPSATRQTHRLLPTRGRRCDALCSLIMTEAAVRRYVIENGSPPESLAALVPEYLPTLPVDPYGDAPLRYRRTEGGYLLYSMAPTAWMTGDSM